MLGIFDSGLGGLTVVRAIEKRLPQAGYVYLGDTARLPYGTKSPTTIERYALQALAFLREAGATTPVIACHTVSSVLAGSPSFRRACANLFEGTAPLDVVMPAVAAARKATRNGRIGVLGTAATIRSRVYERELRGKTVVPVAASVLVGIAEEGWGKDVAVRPLLRKVLAPLRTRRVDTVVLGCTHFPILKRQIRDILGSRVVIIDPGDEVAALLEASGGTTRGTRSDWRARHFFATDIPDDFSLRASRFLGRPITAEAVTL